ncbi:hypothetical protein GCM10010399_40940 [Dactylosporangium fulvum]|uniref:DUF3099 domain-containing protein n=1 Tax=Dactylosporangium fulvum TaxID=53359 RepID=A0ABY5W421_9ACTN|nr:DUF3099 domain-containing protein [Dactylosporangium fulvum]UWP84282.1 DUF3099 domain-containing protein [Dactylosporangium fulvum]
MARRERPQLITDAARSPEQELREREVRYVLMMLLRAVCVVVAAILVATRPPLLWLWLTLCIVGAVVLPWAAVLLANDKAPRPEHQLRNKLHRRPTSHPDPAHALHDREHRVIDVEK